MTEQEPSRLDKRAVRRSFGRAAPAYDEVAVLQQEVGRRLLERLDYMRVAPRTVLDLGCGTGQVAEGLARRYRRALVTGIDIAESMLRLAAGRGPWWNRPRWAAGDIEVLPVRGGCADMILSNLTLQWCNDLPGVLGELRRALAPGGMLLFSTFGPDTLRELRAAWAAVDDHTHTNRFIDMHIIGDELLRAGFADPVMDMEHFTLTYKDVRALMCDLKAMGAHNVTAGRRRGLTGRGALARVEAEYEKLRRDGVLPATFEVIYGHAWAPQDSVEVQLEVRG